DSPVIADVERVSQIDVRAADIFLEEIRVGLADEHDVAVSIASNQVGELCGGSGILQNRRDRKAADDDCIFQVNPEGVGAQAQIGHRLEHRGGRQGGRFFVV